MPFYDYKCLNCGYVQEEYHGMNTELEIKCKECGEKLKKQISGGGMIEFWGDGKKRTIIPGLGGRDEK